MPRKRAEPIIKISVVASPETEQEISQRLQNIFDLTPVTEIDAIRGSMRVSIYFEDPSHTPEDTKRFFPDADVTLERLRKEDWAESWKRHFKPFEIGNKLLVKPSWAKREPRAKQ